MNFYQPGLQRVQGDIFQTKMAQLLLTIAMTDSLRRRHRSHEPLVVTSHLTAVK